MPFLDAFMKEVEAAFSQLFTDLGMVFNILDPRTLLEKLDLLDEYGVDELDIMVMTNLTLKMVMNHFEKLI